MWSRGQRGQAVALLPRPDEVPQPGGAGGRLPHAAGLCGAELVAYQVLVALPFPTIPNTTLPPKVCVEACPDKTTSLWAYATVKKAGIVPGFDTFDLDFQRKLCIASLHYSLA